MIIGIHALIYSRAPEETRALLQKILKTRTVDAGGGWPIIALPPAEIAVHPTDGAPSHELWLMCDNLDKTLNELERAGILATGPVSGESWGRWSSIGLGGGEKLGLYEPRHPSPILATRKSSARRTAGKARNAPAKKVAAKHEKRR